jgi:sterol desaturase/sphingolipid hydroxylase (fatty acid hydroxylase superfamily)
MQLSKFEYYADYVAYPIVIVTLAATASVANGLHDEFLWCGAMLGGFALWSLLEYWAHRTALHHMPYFIPMHDQHHSAPLAYVGTPTWFSMLVLGATIFAPAWGAFGFNAGSGLFVGVSAGYFWYGSVHHLIHHRPNLFRLGILRSLRMRHLRHHYSPTIGNFGVTTALWDHVFGTVIPVESPASH